MKPMAPRRNAGKSLWNKPYLSPFYITPKVTPFDCFESCVWVGYYLKKKFNVPVQIPRDHSLPTYDIEYIVTSYSSNYAG